jgi:hypothetical protein
MFRPDPIPPSLTPRLPRLLATRAGMHYHNARVLLSLAIQHRELRHVARAREAFRAARDCARFGRVLRDILRREVGPVDTAAAIQLARLGVLS